MLKETLTRIESLTLQDVANLNGSVGSFGSTIPTLFASLIEETGEFARAVKIEDGIIKHGKLAEPSHTEACDVMICCYMLYFAGGGKMDDLRLTTPLDQQGNIAKIKSDAEKSTFIWRALVTSAQVLGEIGVIIQELAIAANPMPMDLWGDYLNTVLELSAMHTNLYVARGGDFEQIWQLINLKLDKWQKNQHERTPANGQ